MNYIKQTLLVLSIVALTLGLLAHNTATPEETQKPNFDTIKNWGGGMILEQEQEGYGFHIYSDEQNWYMALEFILERIKGKAVWEYKDHIVVPTYEKTHRLIYGLCKLNGTFDGRIAAIVLSEDKEELGDALIAWSADLDTNKINEISTEGIICINEGYGV